MHSPCNYHIILQPTSPLLATVCERVEEWVHSVHFLGCLLFAALAQINNLYMCLWLPSSAWALSLSKLHCWSLLLLYCFCLVIASVFFFFLLNLVLKMGLSGKLQLSLLWSLVVVVSVSVLCGRTVRAVDSSSSTSMVPELLLLSGKDQNGEMESSAMRRMLANSPSYISYGALSSDRIPCPAGSGRSYYTNNCYAANGPVTPYTRGCSAITLCARGWIVMSLLPLLCPVYLCRCGFPPPPVDLCFNDRFWTTVDDGWSVSLARDRVHHCEVGFLVICCNVAFLDFTPMKFMGETITYSWS